jgi:hypothetical protein
MTELVFVTEPQTDPRGRSPAALESPQHHVATRREINCPGGGFEPQARSRSHRPLTAHSLLSVRD